MQREIVKVMLGISLMIVIVDIVPGEEQEPNAALIGAAAQEPNGLGTVEDYLRYAALNDANLKGAFEQWRQAAQAAVPGEKSLLGPKLTYGYYIKEVETQAPQERQRVGVRHTFGLFGGTEAAKDEAEAKAEAARLVYEAAKLRLFWEVKEAFYEYAYLENATGIAREHIAAIEGIKEVAKSRYWWTAASIADAMFTEMEKFRLEDMLGGLERLRVLAAVKLNKVLNRPAGAAIARSVGEEVNPVELNHDAMVAMLRQRNPELGQLDREIEAARSRIEIAKMESYPDIGVGVDFIRTERAMASGIKPGEKDPTFVTVSMSVPFGRDSYEAAQQRATAEVRKKEQERIEAENGILAKAVRVIYDYEDSTSRIRLYRDGLLERCENSVKTLEKEYKTRMQNICSLIDARRILLSYQLGYEKALASNRQKFAELEMLTGTKLN